MKLSMGLSHSPRVKLLGVEGKSRKKRKVSRGGISMFAFFNKISELAWNKQ